MRIVVLLVIFISVADANVCTQTYTCNGKCYSAERYYTSCGTLGWGRCSKYRSISHNCNQACVREICCPGYTGEPECTQPLCYGSTTCPNGGTCVSPDHCRCPEGFQSPDCIDECDRLNGSCEQQCTSQNGSFSCSCDSGFELQNDSVSCVDEDECDRLNGGCEQQCTNHTGSFPCSCASGFELQNDSVSCSDVDECDTLNGGCLQLCTNQEGSFSCSCNSGFELQKDSISCNNVHECEILNGGCEHLCANGNGSFFCSCNSGFELHNNNTTCTDVNECDINNGGCEQQCTYQNGSFFCSCNPGYQLQNDNISCIDVSNYDEVNVNCDRQCVNVKVTFTCRCNETDTRNDIYCFYVDKCEPLNVTCHQRCLILNGSLLCSCDRGFILSEDGFTCIDVRSSSIVSTVKYEVDSDQSNLQNISSHIQISKNVKESLLLYFRNYTVSNVSISISEIRIGSIIADFTLVYGGAVHSIDRLVLAIVQLYRGVEIRYGGTLVKAKAEVPENVCTPSDIRYFLIGECKDGLRCQIISDKPVCKNVQQTSEGFSRFPLSSDYLHVATTVVPLLLIVTILSLIARYRRKHLVLRNRIQVIDNEARQYMEASSDECTSIRIEVLTDTDNYIKDISTLESGIFTAWKQCIAEMDIPGINKLLDKELLPTASELNEACSAFKRRSPIVARICGKICKDIMNVSENITSTWAAYPYPCKSKDEECNVIFVVYTKQPKCPNICFRDFSIYQRGESEFSDESKTAVSLEITPHDEDNQLIDIENLQMIIENNADTLLDKHSNINAIASGIKKSVGYTQDHHIQEPVLCVVIYVHVKGLIPLEEDPFPTYIDKYPTDVLEGDVTLFNKGPFDYREHVIMGLAIKANNVNSVGTLGGFVTSNKYGICALTCCHCLFSENEISQINSNGGNLPVDLQNCTTVYQACHQESNSFGTVAEVINNEKMDVALINVFDRFPESGEFPKTDVKTGDSNPPEFYSGRIREPNDIQRGTDIFKFGVSTNFTKGRFNLPSKTVVINKRFRRRVFKGQIEVISTDKIFAEEGDSGALIFLSERKRTFCLGLIVAGFTDGRVLATPIGKILTALDCPNRLMSFRPVNRLSGDSGVDDMEVDDD